MAGYRFRACTIFFLLFLPSAAHSVVIDNPSAWSGIFAGNRVTYPITLTGKPRSHAAISWELATQGRTLSVGRQTVRFSDSPTVIANLSLNVPAVKPQIKLPATLIVKAQGGDRSESTTSYKFKIDIYGPDILIVERRKLERLDIRLFDPAGETSKLFNMLNIPFTGLDKAERLGRTRNGLIVVGSATSLDRERKMVDMLIDLAENGRAILILQPASGTIPVPGRGTTVSGKAASGVSFADDSVVRIFAHNHQWIKQDPVRRFGIGLIGDRGETAARITGYKQSSWSWLNIAFDRTGGRFTVFMLPVVEHAFNSPVAQIVLGRLLTFVGGPPANS